MFQNGPTPGVVPCQGNLMAGWSHAQAGRSPRMVPLPSLGTCHHIPHCRNWYTWHHLKGPQNESFVLVSSPCPLSQVLLELPPQLPPPPIQSTIICNSISLIKTSA